MTLQSATYICYICIAEPTGRGNLRVFAPPFLALENDIRQFATPTRCGGHMGNSPPMVRCCACGFGVEGAEKIKCVCAGRSTLAARFPLCQSVAATDRASWTRSAINQTAATAEQGPAVSSLVAQFSEKSRPPMTLLKCCSCRINRQRRNPENNPIHVTYWSQKKKVVNSLVGPVEKHPKLLVNIPCLG